MFILRLLGLYRLLRPHRSTSHSHSNYASGTLTKHCLSGYKNGTRYPQHCF